MKFKFKSCFLIIFFIFIIQTNLLSQYTWIRMIRETSRETEMIYDSKLGSYYILEGRQEYRGGIAKIDLNLKTEWHRDYMLQGETIRFHKIKKLSDESLLLLGYYIEDTVYKPTILNIKTNGDVIKSKYINSNQSFFINDLVILSDKIIIVLTKDSNNYLLYLDTELNVVNSFRISKNIKELSSFQFVNINEFESYFFYTTDYIDRTTWIYSNKGPAFYLIKVKGDKVIDIIGYNRDRLDKYDIFLYKINKNNNKITLIGNIQYNKKSYIEYVSLNNNGNILIDKLYDTENHYIMVKNFFQKNFFFYSLYHSYDRGEMGSGIFISKFDTDGELIWGYKYNLLSLGAAEDPLSIFSIPMDRIGILTENSIVYNLNESGLVDNNGCFSNLILFNETKIPYFKRIESKKNIIKIENYAGFQLIDADISVSYYSYNSRYGSTYDYCVSSDFTPVRFECERNFIMERSLFSGYYDVNDKITFSINLKLADYVKKFKVYGKYRNEDEFSLLTVLNYKNGNLDYEIEYFYKGDKNIKREDVGRSNYKILAVDEKDEVIDVFNIVPKE